MIAGPNCQIVFGTESERLKDQMRLMIQSLQKKQTFLVPIKGRVLDLEVAPDDTFSQKVLGDGFLIDPVGDTVVAPLDAEVMHLFPSLHAIALKASDETEILIHVGIDTVHMKGEGFKAFVKIGDQVKQGQVLIQFDLSLIKQKAKSALTPIVFTNPDKVIQIPRT